MCVKQKTGGVIFKLSRGEKEKKKKEKRKKKESLKDHPASAQNRLFIFIKQKAYPALSRKIITPTKEGVKKTPVERPSNPESNSQKVKNLIGEKGSSEKTLTGR
eukprot:TRINITY_DN2827_c0_g1_i1.p1 TRINITY_DN2827_c0_g1~~TRINITY_DN2827_c0_g1_i1.p1  ORF type:complete len:104 (-),score=13.16 TRINITY_DN2827_c0_g1_i1:643-954(-)